MPYSAVGATYEDALAGRFSGEFSQFARSDLLFGGCVDEPAAGPNGLCGRRC
jgi:hypothetical protein